MESMGQMMDEKTALNIPKGVDPAKAGISFRDGVRVWDADNAALAKKDVFFGPMTLQHCIDACSQAREVLNLSESTR
jgi:hypothetical protein